MRYAVIADVHANLLLPPRLGGWSPILDDLLLVWLAGRPEEFADRIRFLPV